MAIDIVVRVAVVDRMGKHPCNHFFLRRGEKRTETLLCDGPSIVFPDVSGKYRETG